MTQVVVVEADLTDSCQQFESKWLTVSSQSVAWTS